MRHVSIKFLSLLLLLFMSSFALSAQDTTSVVGTVTDTTGAVLPDTAVVLTNPLNGTKLTQKTDNKGFYRFNAVPATNGYQVTFTHEGFAANKVVGITLNIGETRTQNAVLSAGSTAAVEVSANSSQVTIDTTDATIGNNIDVEELNDLPIYDRTGGITTLFRMQPGVDLNSGSVTGARADQNSVTLDGVDVNDLLAGGAFTITGHAPVDSVEQFTGSIAGLVPAVGTGSGGQFQLVTKSGKNQFHGLAYEYHRDTTTVANSWFNNHTDPITPRTPLIQNQFGGNFGGPIKRDKLFFFFDYAGSRIIQSNTAEATVPLAAMRNGELNYINNGVGCDASSRINTQPQCISTLTSDQIAALDPAGLGVSDAIKALLNARYPEPNDPNGGDGVNTEGFRFTYPSDTFDTTYVGRGDWNITSKQKLFARVTFDRYNAPAGGCTPAFKGDPTTCPFQDSTNEWVVSHIWTLGSNKVNEAYLGDISLNLSTALVWNPLLPYFYNLSSISSPYVNNNGGQGRTVPLGFVRDDFNWEKGSHNLGFGGVFKWIKANTWQKDGYPNINIGQAGPGLSGGLKSNLRPPDINSATKAINDWDSAFPMMLGVIGSTTQTFNYDNKGNPEAITVGNNTTYRSTQTELYAADTWKLNRKLTLTYGLRWSYYTVPYEINGLQTSETQIPLNTWINERIQQQNSGNFTNDALPLYSLSLSGKANNAPGWWHANRNDFAPRLAFAYTPYGNGKTVFNGSAGVVFDRTLTLNIPFYINQLTGLFVQSGVVNNITGGSAYNTLLTNPRVGANLAFDSSLLPTAPKITIPLTPNVDSTGTPVGLENYSVGAVFQRKTSDPYSVAVNFGVQQELPWKMVLKMNYAGRFGRRLIAFDDGNQILDVPDTTKKSNQTMAQAFGDLTLQARANSATSGWEPTVQEPWFEDMLGNAAALNGEPNNTQLVYDIIGQYANNGDIGDAIYLLNLYNQAGYAPGAWKPNMGVPQQFAVNGYMTNNSASVYHGLLITLDKNLSNGLRFELNYTLAHSLDNYSQVMNGGGFYSATGMMCDYTKPRACRGNSDFDVRQTINSFFTYDLPFGRGRMYGSHMPRVLDEVIGGWTVSGIPSYRTGLAQSALASASIASLYGYDYATFTGGNKGVLRTHVNVDPSSGQVWQFAGGQSGSNKVWSQWQGPVGLQYGNRNIMYGPGAINFDAGLAKAFPIWEQLKLKFRADAFNVLNHPDWATGATSVVGNQGNFGQITGTSNSPRVMQFSLRLEF